MSKAPQPPEAGLRELYDAIAPHFARTRQRPWPDTMDFVDSIYRDMSGRKGQQTLLDLGCGNGRNALYALEKGFLVLALDFSLELLKILDADAGKRGYRQRLELLNGNMLTLPLEENSVDCAMSIAALHHLATREKRLRALGECRRVMKTGGRALFSVWAFDQDRFREEYVRHLASFSRDEKAFGNLLVDWRSGTQPGTNGDTGVEEQRSFKRFYHLFVEGELAGLCEEAGFHLVSSFRSGDNYYVVVEK